MQQKENIQVHHYESPCGRLLLGAYAGQICICDWADKARRSIIDRRIQTALTADYEVCVSDVIRQAVMQLDEYFAHRRQTFSLPLLLIGTPFQKAVWQTLLTIPYGQTVSYASQALQLGKPKAVRAVAAANGANPVSIFVPCHRVIGSDNKLTGYGGGLSAKQFLLNLERPQNTLLF